MSDKAYSLLSAHRLLQLLHERGLVPPDTNRVIITIDRYANSVTIDTESTATTDLLHCFGHPSQKEEAGSCTF